MSERRISKMSFDYLGQRHVVVGQFARMLAALVAAGERGVTAADRPAGTRVSHYVFRLRRDHGLPISMDLEPNADGAGSHGRYRMVAPIKVASTEYAAPKAERIAA